MRQPVIVQRAELSSPVAQRLIERLNNELTVRYPEEGANHFRLDSEDVVPGCGAFLLAFADNEAIGCGAIRALDDATAEIKRMYVVPEARGKGVGRALLTALEEHARALGLRRVVLEAGDRQPEALALYERAGFGRVPRFGEYVGSPLSVCMAKDLPGIAPTTEAELLARARRLAGRPLSHLAGQLGLTVPPDQRRAKGWVGQLLERSLGATAASRAVPDFTALGVEMKTLPVDTQGTPRETTFVATLDPGDPSAMTWETSSVRKKLRRVLWVPIEASPELPLGGRRVGMPLLWSPSPEEEAGLRQDFEEIVDLIEGGFPVSGKLGQLMQLRPKGADSKALRWATDPEGAPVRTAPRAFYLRTSFTAGIIRRNYLVAR